MTELKNRLVNLDVAPGFTKEAAVLANNPKGPVTGDGYPTSLMHPDYSFPEPRIGIAWRPISGSSLLVRAGYGIYNDTACTRQRRMAMAQQAPLSTSLSVANSRGPCRFTIARRRSPQLPCSTTTPDTFAVDPNFKVGYAQQWQLSVQRDLPFSLQMVATYSGHQGDARGAGDSAELVCAGAGGGPVWRRRRRATTIAIRTATRRKRGGVSRSCGGGCATGLRRI